MNFINGYCIIRNNRIVKDRQLIFEDPGAGVHAFLNNGYNFINPGYPKFHKMDSLSKLGFLGCEVVLGSRNLKTEYAPEQIGVVLSNVHGSLDTDKLYFQSTEQVASPSLFVYTLPNIVAGEICIRHGIKGENAFFIFDKFEAATLCDYTNAVLAGDTTHACIAGWVDVLGETYDVFLYLVEKREQTGSISHIAENLLELYHGATEGNTETTDH